MRIEPVSRSNAMAILDFEIANRAFFEKTLPSRGNHYYNIDQFLTTIDLICEDQSIGELYMNIILDAQENLIGRVNLFPTVLDPYKRVFELGYRLGEAYGGKGYATEAVKQLVTLAQTEYHIEAIVASTAPDNIASQKVLLKNGFTFVKRIENDILIHDHYEDSFVFILDLTTA